jgi:voltage-gated potassium channel
MPIFMSLALMLGLFRELWELFKKPQYRSLIFWAGIILLGGMIFYHQVEGWSWLDALYFSVVTLSTVGYGDLTPTTPVGKIFTVAYILMGISIFITFASMLVKEREEIYRQRMEKKKNQSNEGSKPQY